MALSGKIFEAEILPIWKIVCRFIVKENTFLTRKNLGKVTTRIIELICRLYREDRNVSEVADLKHYFVKNSTRFNQTTYVDSIVRGMATQNSHKIDNTFEDAVVYLIFLIEEIRGAVRVRVNDDVKFTRQVFCFAVDALLVQSVRRIWNGLTQHRHPKRKGSRHTFLHTFSQVLQSFGSINIQRFTRCYFWNCKFIKIFQYDDVLRYNYIFALAHYCNVWL